MMEDPISLRLFYGNICNSKADRVFRREIGDMLNHLCNAYEKARRRRFFLAIAYNAQRSAAEQEATACVADVVQTVLARLFVLKLDVLIRP